MKSRYMSMIGACAISVFASDVNSTAFTVARMLFELKPAESLLFQQIACGDRYGVQLDKAEAADETGAKQLDYSKDVYVRCRPHRRIEGQPVKYLVDCRRGDLTSAWECDPGKESMLARVGGILVSITGYDGDATNLDQAFLIVKHLRSSGQLKDELAEESLVPGEEGFVRCHTLRRYSDNAAMLSCPGVNDVPLTRARELQP